MTLRRLRLDALIVVLAVAGAYLASAPSPADQPTARFDVSASASAAQPSGAPTDAGAIWRSASHRGSDAVGTAGPGWRPPPVQAGTDGAPSPSTAPRSAATPIPSGPSAGSAETDRGLRSGAPQHLAGAADTASPEAVPAVGSDAPYPAASRVRPRRSTPAADRAVQEAESAAGTHIRGVASWFCRPGRSACTAGYGWAGAYAAAGPSLRVGDWRGREVRVCAATGCIDVRLIDACQCGNGARLIDLYASVFRQLAPLHMGLVEVQVLQ